MSFCSFKNKFIATYLKLYGLVRCHYFSSPGLNWDAVLKMIGVKVENMSGIGKYLFIEKGLRGGISNIAKRHAKANNKYMNDYDPKKLSTFTSYLDMNNLYGWAMSGYLPYEGFRRLKNVDEFGVTSVSEKGPIGYFLEVDLEYPDELHELHNDYLLAPEKTTISSDMLLKYYKTIADKYEIKIGDVVHYRNLQLYLSLGMNLTKFHRVLKFK